MFRAHQRDSKDEEASGTESEAGRFRDRNWDQALAGGGFYIEVLRFDHTGRLTPEGTTGAELGAGSQTPSQQRLRGGQARADCAAQNATMERDFLRSHRAGADKCSTKRPALHRVRPDALRGEYTEKQDERQKQSFGLQDTSAGKGRHGLTRYSDSVPWLRRVEPYGKSRRLAGTVPVLCVSL